MARQIGRSTRTSLAPSETLTRFVGRRRELAAVDRLLREARLVTLAGTGGCGKTRLALEVARRTSVRVGLVRLAPLRQSVQVRTAIDSALDGRGDDAMLLIVDNCEHVLGAVRSVLPRLLDATPSLRILATSREPLGLPEEQVWRVPPLSLPQDGGMTEPRGRRSDAVQLFVDRASLSRPDFALDDTTCAAVSEICRALDGIPLAIELAAARLRHLPLDELRLRVRSSLGLLERRGAAGDDPRHRTMRTALDWSHSLLEPSERVVLRRLSVFVDGCTLPAAEAVCAEDDFAREDVLDALASLVDRSVVTLGSDGRYRLLETTRQYAQEHLARSAETDRTRERAARYLAEFVTGELRDDGLPQDHTSARRVREEFATVADLLPTLQDLSPRDALRLLTQLAHPQMAVGRAAELREWISEALDAYPLRDSSRAYGLLGRGNLLVARDLAAALRDADEALAIAHEQEDSAAIAASHHLRAVIATHRGDDLGALREFDIAVPMCRALDNPGRLAIALAVCAIVRQAVGDGPRADKDIAEAFASCDRQMDPTGPNRVLILLAAADIAYAQGRGEDARAHLRESLELIRRRSLFVRPAAFQALATIAASAGERERAVRLAGIAESLAGGKLDMRTSPLRALGDASWVDGLEKDLGPRGARLRASGRALSSADAFACALEEGATALSRRELEVAALIAEGFTSREVASRLRISERTAEHHVDHILVKLDLRSRTQLARWMAERASAGERSAARA